MAVTVKTADGRTTFVAGDVVRLRMTWQLDRPPKRLTARLFWRTSGKGTTDAVTVAEAVNELAQPSGEWTIDLTIPPDAPPSYDGRLLSVAWFAGADAGRRGEAAAIDLVVSPTGSPLVPRRLEK